MTDTPGTQPAAQSPDMDPTAGFGALFDFSFKHFITLSVMKILFMLGIAMIAIGWLIMVVTGFTTGILGGLGAIIIGSIVAVIQVVFLRVWLELIAVIFRIGQNTTILVERGGTKL